MFHNTKNFYNKQNPMQMALLLVKVTGKKRNALK